VPLTIIGDPLRIQQVLSNLISNAIKFTPKGEIVIRMELDIDLDSELILRVSVCDTGIGIDAANISGLFQSFSQADASITRKFGGTGLGLVISKQLVELMGGSISVSSELGKGSRFSFTIQCRKGRSYNWLQDSECLKNIRALVVDDQETSCTILRNILESWHLHVETALSAEEGLRKIYEAERVNKPFNLLLLDWKLDGMSGLALAHELELRELEQKQEHHPTVIMVTAYSKELLQKEIVNSATHLDSILTKPVIPSALLNTLLQIYRKKSKNNALATKATINPYELAKPLYNVQLLLVEDNELNQQVAGDFLEKAGLRVSIANHGGEAVQWVQKKDFDVILMDLQMPEMDGYEATKRIRALPNGKNLPIIAMTAAAMQNDKEACLAVGMNGHVSKPIQPIELINTLLHWVKPTAAKSSASPHDKQKESNLADRLPDFDLENIMMMLANDEEKLIHILGDLRERFLSQLPIIIAKITEGDLVTAEQYLHTLKGTAGNLGATDLYRASAELDAQLSSGTYRHDTLAHWLAVFEKTMDSIADLTPQTQSTFKDTSFNMATLQQIISQIETLLAHDKFISDALLIQLKNLLPAEQQTQYDNLSQLIIDTHYPEALSVLTTLRGSSYVNH
jgi:CheY-like chemotaxis protein